MMTHLPSHPFRMEPDVGGSWLGTFSFQGTISRTSGSGREKGGRQRGVKCIEVGGVCNSMYLFYESDPP